MPDISDRDYLLGQQYSTGANLNARIAVHERFSTNRYDWYRWFFDLLDGFDNLSVLEVGAGTGRLWTENRDRLPGNAHITLSDLSTGMLDEARASLGDHTHGFNFVIADAQDIPYGDGSFDLVIANFMLYHVPDRRRALAEMHRVLRPGGRFLCTLNGQRHMAQFRSLLAELGAPFFPDAVRFTLEEAEGVIARQFPHAELHRYPDSLEVTEVQTLIDYALSTTPREALQHGTRLNDLRARLERDLEEHGAIHIAKDMGTFIARRL